MCFLQAQTLIKPTFVSEILEKYISKPYFKLAKGEASEILILDTLYSDNGKNYERTIYSFNRKRKFSVKKYKNKNLVGYETIEIDSIGRIFSYTDSLNLGSIKINGNVKKHITRIRSVYKDDKKIVERIDGDGRPVLRYIVYYDSLKNPTMILESFFSDKNYSSNSLQTIDYNYEEATFICSNYNYKSEKPDIINGFINLDYVIERNEQGDFTKIYWPISKKTNGFIYEIDYNYDEYGNWVEMFKTLVKPGESSKTLSKTYRIIEYKQ